MSGQVELAAGGHTHAGQIRDNNEDCYLIDGQLGLYGVFDGMGGHHAGEVASATARDAIHAALRRSAEAGELGPVAITEAFQCASAAVHAEAERRRARRGIGTTAVLCQMLADGRVLIAHVGDSRAYLLRERRLQQLTPDHTIVAELLARGAISADEALRHPYRSVLSRNLGSRPEATPDIRELQLQPGDRLLLCSDGLSGFASDQGIQHTLSGALDTEVAARELIELALKGGGGDNVTAVVVEAGRAEVPRRTKIIRTTGADAWWQRRELFLAQARARGVASSPLCAVLSPDEAVEIVAGNLGEAIYRDLEQTTGVHVWTYADNLAAGWLDQGGEFSALRDLIDQLIASAHAVLEDVSKEDPGTGALLAVAVPRALLVIEMAMGAVLGRRLRAVEVTLARAEAARAATETLSESVTIPVNVPRAEPPPPEVQDCLERALEAAVAGVQADERGDNILVVDCLRRAHEAAVVHGGQLDGTMVAREIFGNRSYGEPVVDPLLAALDRARGQHTTAIRRTAATEALQAAALRRVVVAHRLMYSAVAHMIVEMGRPISDELKEAAATVAMLHAKAGDNERRISGEQRRLQTQPGWAAPEDES